MRWEQLPLRYSVNSERIDESLRPTGPVVADGGTITLGRETDRYRLGCEDPRTLDRLEEATSRLGASPGQIVCKGLRSRLP